MGVRVDYANKVHVDNLDTIYITGAGVIDYPFKGISRDSAMGWQEPAFSSELTRSTDLVLSNIDKVDFGLVYRCEISYKYMNVQDYMILMRIAKQRTCNVKFYSREEGEWVRREMAFTGNESGKLYAFGPDYLGVSDISIKLVATNRDQVGLIKKSYTISYNANGGNGTIASQSVAYGDYYEISDGVGLTKPGYSLVGFNTKPDGSEWAYLPNQAITVFKDITLYAQWG